MSKLMKLIIVVVITVCVVFPSALVMDTLVYVHAQDIQQSLPEMAERNQWIDSWFTTSAQVCQEHGGSWYAGFSSADCTVYFDSNEVYAQIGYGPAVPSVSFLWVTIPSISDSLVHSQ